MRMTHLELKETHLELTHLWFQVSHFAQVVMARGETQEIPGALASSAKQSVSRALIGRKSGVAAPDWSVVTRVPRRTLRLLPLGTVLVSHSLTSKKDGGAAVEHHPGQHPLGQHCLSPLVRLRTLGGQGQGR